MTILDTLCADARAQSASERKTSTPRNAGKDLVLAGLFSPGFQLLTMWRIAARLHVAGFTGRQFAKPLLWLTSILFGCYINPNAKLGREITLPHPVGIVIGEGVRIEQGTTIYQHVTLGLARVADPAYPSIGADVVLYAGAVVAGAVTIGNNSWIGANAVVLSDVPPFSTASGNPATSRSQRSRTQPT